ncbi:MAG: flagellar hook-length control protein FliK [Thermoanaerobacteraceae bacterium]|nr:flagellar hook-length control protein FliK [Thermoanaerobacteraceae bacterium]
MDIVLEVCQFASDAPKVSHDGKSCNLANNQEFGQLLENIRSLVNKPVTDETKESDINALLMQLLNLLNIDISVRDFEALLNQQQLNPSTNLELIDLDIKFPADELNRCWRAIISEFNTTGDINESTVNKFYLAMKKVISRETDIDLNSLKDMINQTLKNNNNKTKTSETAENRYNDHFQENNTLEHKSYNLQDGKNVKLGKLDTTQNTNTNISTKDETSQTQKVIIKDETLDYDGLHEYKKLQIDSNWLQQDNISPHNTQETFATSVAKTEIPTLSAKSYDPPDIFEQLVDKVQFALKGDAQQVNVRLKPDYLGEVLIKVFADKGKLKVELFVENSQVRSMLKAHVFDFQNQIREQGYDFSEINVYKMSDGLEMGTFSHQSGSDGRYQAKKFKAGFNRPQTEDHQVTLTDNYSLWENISNVNYMV